jgi:predicted alpha/beta superfamily hydrolase
MPASAAMRDMRMAAQDPRRIASHGSSRSAGQSIGRRTFLALAAAAAAMPAYAATEPQGRIVTLPPLDFPDHPPSRIRIWLPPGYDTGTRPYRTLYMLDGQLAFAADFDGENFAADRRMATLATAGRIGPALIVAIDNLEEARFLQYMPQTIYDQAEPTLRAAVDREMARLPGRPLVSAPFIRFLATRLKPYVDAHFRTSPGRLDTAIFGASMAGVMAGAIFVEAQRAFGRGACMSPNWAIYDRHFIDYPQLLSLWPDYFARLGVPDGRRLWLDHGTRMMDAGMAPHQIGIARRLAELGWQRGRNLEGRVYQDAGHAYASTAVQMDELLVWLLA